MKIVIAPDSFKGSLSAEDVCRSMERGVLRAAPHAKVVKLPMADGGEGTVDALVLSTGGRKIRVKVRNPLGREITAEYGILGDGQTAVIEMASASGLTLIRPDERNPMRTTTYGTGQLIAYAVDKGCRRFIIGLGGSATNDGGMGMACALGYRFTDADGRELRGIGENLVRLRHIDASGVSPLLRECSFTAACDVDNPLCGPAGAASVYGRQKGADDEMIAALDKGLLNFASVVKECLGADMDEVAGSGAAGGMGGGITAFLGGSLQSGIDMIIDASGLKDRLCGADLVLTGEGRIDSQTAHGKTLWGVAREASAPGVPVVAICGSLGEGYRELYASGFTSIMSIAPGPISLESCIERAPELISNAAEAVVRMLVLSRRLQQED